MKTLQVLLASVDRQALSTCCALLCPAWLWEQQQLWALQVVQVTEDRLVEVAARFPVAAVLPGFLGSCWKLSSHCCLSEVKFWQTTTISEAVSLPSGLVFPASCALRSFLWMSVSETFCILVGRLNPCGYFPGTLACLFSACLFDSLVSCLLLYALLPLVNLVFIFVHLL